MAARPKAMRKTRSALMTRPTGRFTADRSTLLEMENEALKEYFSLWLTDMTGTEVNSSTFCEDVADGTVLCFVMAKVEDSGLDKYHVVADSPGHLKKFHARDNLVKFQDACRRLALPDTVTLEELEAGNPSRLISLLVYLEEICDEDGVEPVLGERESPEERRKSFMAMREQEETKRRSSKRRSSKRRSSKRSAGEEPEFLAKVDDFMARMREFCGCGRSTVVP